MEALFDLTGQVAIVTGAAKGLGKDYALALATAGADLVLTGRKLENLSETHKLAEDLGSKVFLAQMDILNEESIISAIESSYDHYGKIDILVNNAGYNNRQFALSYSWDEWSKIVDTNMKGSFFVAKEVIKKMIPKNYGRIINIGSGTAAFGYKTVSAYAASRGGIKQMTMCLAAELAEYGITVNCLSPGWFITDMTTKQFKDPDWSKNVIDRIPMKRFGTRHDLDSTIIYFASKASNYVTGQIIYVDGGFSTGDVPAPNYVDIPEIMNKDKLSDA